MKRFYFSFICLFIILCAFGQEQTYSTTVYYNINASRIETNGFRLDSLLDLAGNRVMIVNLYAYADYLSNETYNIQLSKKRLEEVKRYIKQQAKGNLEFKETIAYGEKYSNENSSLLGEPSQRRVDVYITTHMERKKISKQPLETHTSNRSNQPKEAPIKKEPTKKVTLQKSATELQKNISELKEGESLTIEGLSFIPGRHMLMKSAIPILEDLLVVLKENEDLNIEIQGHICCLPSSKEDGLDYDTGTWDLSETRAEAVYNYLIRNGIEKTRLTYKGYGHQFPKVSPERTPEDEQLNRRVEIKVLEN